MKQLKNRIKEAHPELKIGKIKLHGDSFKIIIKTANVNLKQLEQQLREEFSMPGLVLVSHGD